MMTVILLFNNGNIDNKFINIMKPVDNSNNYTQDWVKLTLHDNHEMWVDTSTFSPSNNRWPNNDDQQIPITPNEMWDMLDKSQQEWVIMGD